GVEPGSVVVIGDNWSWDILAASRVGMWQIWVNPPGEAPPPSPDRHLGSIRNFRESPSVLVHRWHAYNSGARF
ncbi:MAG: HAD hydrolase-like protein, partial [Hyphomicrobium sp.]